MSHFPPQKYCDFLLFLAQTEKSIEVKRHKLCQIPAFEPYSSFRLLDQNCKNFITIEDLQSFLVRMSMFFGPDDIFNAFMSRYDFDKDGNLNYSEYFF